MSFKESFKKQILLISSLVVSNFFIIKTAVLAKPLQGSVRTQDAAFLAEAGFTSSSVGDVAALAIEAFLGLLAIIFIILILYAGFNWMTAAGDEQKVTKAKDTIYRAVIGLIITLAAFSITYFVFNALPFNASSSAIVGGDGG